MITLYVGLGNPGKKYEVNRHNVGFMMIDYIVDQFRIQNSEFRIRSPKFKSEIATLDFKGSKYLFAKPQTYMNRSGEAVQAILSYYNLQPSSLVAIYDDLDFRLGDFKIHGGPGPQSHNGVISIEKYLGTRTFTHVRIGVDNRPLNSQAGGRIDGETYVLQNFTEEEMATLQKEVFPRILERIP